MTQSTFHLGQLQRWMQSVITHHDGIEAGIESEQARSQIDLTVDRVEQVVSRSAALSSVQRLAIYGNAYYARLLDCMRASFPCLAYALGEEVFDGFAFGYLQHYPPGSYTLAHLADDFVSYLQQSRPNPQSQEDEPDWPDFLIDLATLEWNIDQVFDGPGVEEEPLLQPSDLVAVTADQWPTARLEPVPCLRLLAFRYPVNTYYTEFRREAAPTPPEPKQEYVALNRREYVVRRVELTEPQYELLGALVRGQTVGDAIQTVAGTGANVERLADDLRVWFQTWSQAGFFRAVHTR